MKKFIIIISLFLSTVVAALLVAPNFIDINKYTPQITKVVKDKTGVNVKINGDLRFKILPNISLEINDVSVGSPIKDDGEIASIAKLTLDLQLIPLLQKKIEVNSFQLSEPSFYLHILSEEKTNVSVLIENAKPEEAEIAHDAEITSHDEDILAETHIAARPLHSMLLFEEIRIKNGNLRIKNDVTDQDFTLSNINIVTSFNSIENPINLSAKLNIFEDSKKGNLDLKGIYFIAEDEYGLQNAKIQLDDIGSYVDFAIRNLKHKPEVKTSFYFDDINLNSYVLKDKVLGKSKKEETKPATKAVVQQIDNNFVRSDEKLDLSFMDAANVNLNFKASSIVYDNLKTGKIMFNGYLRNEKLTLNVSEANIYGGVISSEMVVDKTHSVPQYSSKLNISDIQISQLPNDLISSWAVKGNINTQSNLETFGKSPAQIIRNLDGNLNFSSLNGGIKGLDLASMISSVASKFNIKTRQADELKKMRYDEISGNFIAQKGVFSNNDLVLKSDALNFTGAGKIDLNNLKVDYKLTPKYSNDFEKQNDEPRVPVLITGSLLKPVFRVEVKTIVEDLIKNPQGAEDLVDKLKNDFKDIKKNFNSDALKDLQKLF